MKNDFFLLQNYNETHYFNTPFPHVIIKNALPDHIYNELLKKSPKTLIKNSSLKLNNTRGNFYPDQIEKENSHKFFYEFLNYHQSPFFFEECVKIFKVDIKKQYPGLIEHSKKMIENEKIIKLRSNNKKNKKFMTFAANYGYNTPVTEASSVIGAHLDHYDKIFFGLFYMKEDIDKFSGGDLIFYKWDNKYSNYKKKNIIYTEKWNYMKSHCEEAKRICYDKNTFVLALNSIDSLHGVSKRSETNSIRQFCYFSIASNKDLKFATPNLIEKIFFKNLSYKEKMIIIFNSLKFWIKKVLQLLNTKH